MGNFRLDLCYDGTRYRGWQRLGNSDATIQGKLEQVLGRMTGQAVEVIGSGRTDAGVHALGQVANFHADTAMTAPEILAYLRAYLPEDIGVTAVTAVDERFHSRYNALEKTYCYRIFHSDSPCVFQRRYVYQMAEPLDLEAMEAGAARLLGQHDFLPFSSLKKAKKSTVRTLPLRLPVRSAAMEYARVSPWCLPSAMTGRRGFSLCFSSETVRSSRW